MEKKEIKLKIIRLSIAGFGIACGGLGYAIALIWLWNSPLHLLPALFCFPILLIIYSEISNLKKLIKK